MIKVLIVEDEIYAYKHLTIVLKNISKDILLARTGTDAIEIMQNNGDIDLVLMDIKLPLMNGYEATKAIRQFNKDVIIIAETAYALKGDKEKALEAGCNDYISKPIDKEKLLAKIKKYFQ